MDKSKNRIKIIYFKGEFRASNYPYKGGGKKMIEEIKAYFLANPSEKNSEHTLIITPVKGLDNLDVPFYGLGRWCFALDYNKMDIKHLGGSSELSKNATIYIGGLLHELGHGLNLPHNKQKVSDLNRADKGTALMGSGNLTYGKSPTFLTEASCATLNNNQIFNKTGDSFYSGASANVESIVGSFSNGNLNISGTLKTDVPVNYIGFYNDPDDKDGAYDAISWASAVSENTNFNISMPINELEKNENTPYVLRLRLNHINGEVTRLEYPYRFINGIPVMEFGDKDYLDRSQWSIVSYSSQEDNGGEAANGRASQILDDDASTYWHSCWSGCTAIYPHNLVIDASKTITANGFSFLQRDGSRKIKDIEILVSADNVTWESLGDYALKKINSIQHILLTKEASFRYFKVVAKSSHDESQFAAMAEIKCF